MLPLDEEDTKTLKEILLDLAELVRERGDMPLGRQPPETPEPSGAEEAH